MKQMTIRLPVLLHKKLKEETEQRGISLNAHILNILWKKLDEK